MIRWITWQGKKGLYAVLLRDLRRTDTTEHDLQHEYDKYRRAEMRQSYGASERQIKTMLKESDEMNTYRASTHWLEPDEDTNAPRRRGRARALAAENERDALAAKIDAEFALVLH